MFYNDVNHEWLTMECIVQFSCLIHFIFCVIGLLDYPLTYHPWYTLFTPILDIYSYILCYWIIGLYMHFICTWLHCTVAACFYYIYRCASTWIIFIHICTWLPYNMVTFVYLVIQLDGLILSVMSCYRWCFGGLMNNKQ